MNFRHVALSHTLFEVLHRRTSSYLVAACMRIYLSIIIIKFVRHDTCIYVSIYPTKGAKIDNLCLMEKFQPVFHRLVRVSGTEISTQHSYHLSHFCNRFIELKLQVSTATYQKRNMFVLTFLLPSLRQVHRHRYYRTCVFRSCPLTLLIVIISPILLACSALCSHLSAESWRTKNDDHGAWSPSIHPSDGVHPRHGYYYAIIDFRFTSQKPNTD